MIAMRFEELNETLKSAFLGLYLALSGISAFQGATSTLPLNLQKFLAIISYIAFASAFTVGLIRRIRREAGCLGLKLLAIAVSERTCLDFDFGSDLSIFKTIIITTVISFEAKLCFRTNITFAIEIVSGRIFN